MRITKKKIKRIIDKMLHPHTYDCFWFDAVKPVKAYQIGYRAAAHRRSRYTTYIKYGPWALEGYDDYFFEHPIVIMKIHFE